MVLAGRDADRLKPAPTPFIELGAIGFMKLNFLMTNYHLRGQKRRTGPGATRKAVWPPTRLAGCLSHAARLRPRGWPGRSPFGFFLNSH